MSRKPAWWQNPQTVISCVVGVGAISSWVIGSFVADAKQQAKLEKTEEQVEKLEDAVAEHDTEIEQGQVQQQLIQQDLGYLKDGMKQLLERKR